MLQYSPLDINQNQTSNTTVCIQRAFLENDILCPENWATLSQANKFLEGFEDANRATKKNQATFGKVFPSMEFLLERFEHYSEEYTADEIFSTSFNIGWTKLTNYWNKTERNPVHIAAIVFHPALKWN